MCAWKIREIKQTAKVAQNNKRKIHDATAPNQTKEIKHTHTNRTTDKIKKKRKEIDEMEAQRKIACCKMY